MKIIDMYNKTNFSAIGHIILENDLVSTFVHLKYTCWGFWHNIEWQNRVFDIFQELFEIKIIKTILLIARC